MATNCVQQYFHNRILKLCSDWLISVCFPVDFREHKLRLKIIVKFTLLQTANLSFIFNFTMKANPDPEAVTHQSSVFHVFWEMKVQKFEYI